VALTYQGQVYSSLFPDELYNLKNTSSYSFVWVVNHKDVFHTLIGYRICFYRPSVFTSATSPDPSPSRHSNSHHLVVVVDTNVLLNNLSLCQVGDDFFTKILQV
jgi:hypothetical protein